MTIYWQKDCYELNQWVKAISNHFWWLVQTSIGSSELLTEKLMSCIHTTLQTIIHGIISDCFIHIDMKNSDEANKKKWLSPSSLAHEALKTVVMDKILSRGMAKLSKALHTGSLECFYSVLNKYCPKWQHFSLEENNASSHSICNK